MKTPALLRALRDVVAEYDEKAGAIPATLDTIKQSITDLNTACCIGGTFGGSLMSSTAAPWENAMESVLLKSAWKHVYSGLNLDTIASAKDRKRFEMAFENPAPFTLENIAATFGDYVRDPRFHILKGLAECFCELDPAYKSHSRVKVGVERLPKRIILTSLGSWGSWGYERLKDTLTAIDAFKGRPFIDQKTFAAFLDDASEHGAAYYQGIELRRFMNGNGHLFFDPESLREINLAISEFYGDVLPDTPDENPKKYASTELAKDLQYYPTPKAVAQIVVGDVYLKDRQAVLEPSCGDGQLMVEIKRQHPTARLTGVECHPGRADVARERGFHVHTANFLTCAPNPEFDAVVMNPPFYGRHYLKHIRHALAFLKPGCALTAILPASAHYDHKGLPSGQWHDLPVASFADSGTNIPTGYFTTRAPD